MLSLYCLLLFVFIIIIDNPTSPTAVYRLLVVCAIHHNLVLVLLILPSSI